MKCRVKITQVLEGYIDLEVDKPEDALTLADDMYRLQGMELPDMDDVQPLEFSLAEILHQQDKDINHVFLVPDKNQFWTAAISVNPPAENAVVLTTEQSYPVEFYYERLDMNGSGVTDGYICHDRSELLQTLTWIGQCGHTPLSLWEFDAENITKPDLHALLQNTYQKKCSLIQSIDWGEEEDCNYGTCTQNLDDKLSAAKNAVKSQAADHTDNQKKER